VIGVAVGTMALIVILSVFNGFESVISSLFNAFHPDLRITIAEGKNFSVTTGDFNKIKNMENVAYFSEIVEENALITYDDQQYIATVKGVSPSYNKMTGLDSLMWDGKFLLRRNTRDYAVIGRGIAYYLSVMLHRMEPLVIYVPKRKERITFNPKKAFNRDYIFPSGIFSIEKELDSKYIIVPLDFARNLFDYKGLVTAIELKLAPGADKEQTQKKIQQTLGTDYEVKNRYQQQKLFYKIMKSEKWAIFFILTFILIIASFNVIGSLTMLIIEKKKDMYTLRSMGANIKFIRKIFLLEGWMISAIGAVLGIILGAILCYIQETFGIIQLQGGQSFIIQAYPVDTQISDFIYVFITVLFIGFLAAWYPVRYITRKHLVNDK
jgi:lipoprotein-releasing system permease protein